MKPWLKEWLPAGVFGFLAAAFLGWFAWTLMRNAQRQDDAMRAFCRARFDAAATAQDTVAVLMDREDAWRCEFGLAADQVER